MKETQEDKKGCTKCGTEYPATKEFFGECRKGKKKYLRNICKKCSNKRKRELYYLKKNQVATLESAQLSGLMTANQIKKIEAINNTNSELKIITKYRDLSEKVVRTMRKSKLHKYSQKTQDFCLEIMENLSNFLKTELDDRRIIDVTNS